MFGIFRISQDALVSGDTDKMRRGAALLMLIGLGGCLPDQAKDVTACRTEAERFYHTYEAVEPDDPASQYIIACMAHKGYDFSATSTHCNSRTPLPTQPTCYESNSWLGWIIDHIRNAH
jgi:hypothetical protein